MVAEGKLTKVEIATDWCSNMTVREKQLPSGGTKVRLCLDPSQTVNKAITVAHYQIPTTNEILPRLAAKKFKTFSIFDALDGFTQVKLDEKSSYLTTMHTPWGRYRWCRLPYGVNCAPEEFQKRMHEALDGLPDTYCIADDILIVGLGDTREEADAAHDRNVLALMDRARTRCLKLNPAKIQYKLQKITFMGHILSEDGVAPDPKMTQAISNMPPPTDTLGVMRFCGMVNYLSEFCPHLSQVVQPLYDLTKASHEFLWSPTHQAAFEKAKTLVIQAPCLAYFDQSKSITLQVDASQGGLGGALLQPSSSGKLQPVAYTSCKLRPNEEAWAQIEKECLAIVAACDKWDLWIYGLNVTVHTDHQPLETIFRKSLHSAPRRLQKMLMRLQRYNITVVYKKGSSLVLADTLSRAHLTATNDSTQTNFEVFRLAVEDCPPDYSRITPRTLAQVKQHTAASPDLLELCSVIAKGWPDLKSQLSIPLHPYWTFRDEMTVHDGVVYKGQQVLIPPSLVNDMLEKVHAAHLGAESNFRMCKDALFWPGMRADIREMCYSCGKCAQFKAQNQKEPMQSQPIPRYPWQYVSQDLAVFESGNYLVTVDHYSDFIELDELDNTLSATVADKTEAHFARHGVPEVVLTDNGPQFIGSDYESMCDRLGVQHITSSPYWPQGNGKAEATVKIVKNIMKKSGRGCLFEALLNYRNTPPQDHDLSPAQRSMGRRTRSTIPISRSLLMPSGETSELVQATIAKKRLAAKVQYDKNAGHKLHPVTKGDYAYVKPSPHHRGAPWPYGVVKEQMPNRSVVVVTNNGEVRRNRVQVRPAAPPPPDAILPKSWRTLASAAVSGLSPLQSRPSQQHVNPPETEPHVTLGPRDPEQATRPMTSNAPEPVAADQPPEVVIDNQPTTGPKPRPSPQKRGDGMVWKRGPITTGSGRRSNPPAKYND